MHGPGIAYQGLPVHLAEASAALPTSPPVPVALLSQKHLLFQHCRTTLCTLNSTLECQARCQAATAKAGREELAPAARSWSGAGKPCSAHGDRSLHSPSALLAPQPHTWSPERGHVCVASPCLPHVGVSSQPAPASQHFMVLWFWSVPVNADGLSGPGDVLCLAAVPGLPVPPLQCPAEMASAEPDSEDAAEAEEAVYEEIPCDKMELSQRLAVEELITTEASYVHNMQLCVWDIRAHLQKKQVTPGTLCPGLVAAGGPVQSSEMSKSVQVLPPELPITSQALGLDGH